MTWPSSLGRVYSGWDGMDGGASIHSMSKNNSSILFEVMKNIFIAGRKSGISK